MPIHHTTKSLIPAKVLKRHHTFTLVMSGFLTIPQAAKELDLSIRQTRRLWKIFQERQGDPYALVPKPRKKSSPVLTPSVRKKIIALIEKHPKTTCCHLTDTLNQQGTKLSRESVRKVRKEHAESPQSIRKNTVPTKSFEAKTFGQIIQMDTCIGAWLTGSGYQSLIVCLDDCSRFVVSAGVFSTDSTWTNMCVIKDMIQKWGLPTMLYTDNASHFKTIRHEKLPKWIDKEVYPLTRIQQVLSEIGITHVTHHPYNPRAKGKIERFFRFIQDRLMQHHTARNLIELNYQLHVWLKWYNYEHVNRMTKQKACDRLSPSSFKPLPPEIDLDNIFVVKETRKVSKDNHISFRGTRYHIPEKCHMAGTKVDVHITDHHISIYSNGRFVIKLAIN